MYAVVALCLLGLATAQNAIEIKDLTACITKEQNLKMECSFMPVGADPKPTCKFSKGGKIMGSTDSEVAPDPTYKNRANVTMPVANVCQLELTGLEDKAQEIMCVVKQTKEVNKVLSVDKKTTATCSGLSLLLQKGTALTMLLLTLPVLSELL